jgi:hypothetical protein
MGTQYFSWSPPGAAIRIEYAASLLREARLEGPEGVLYGTGSKEVIRIAAARAGTSHDDARLAGLEMVGIFAVRDRGEVFLTEDDLGRFEQAGCRAALIIAGENAGFFTRERDGSIQSIQSREEISCPAPPSSPKPRLRWIPEIAIVTLALALLATAFLWPRHAEVAIHERSGQLLVSWTRMPGTLAILDGTTRTEIAVTPSMSSLTYLPATGDVQVRFESSRARASARYIGADPNQAEAAALKTKIAGLEQEAASLSAESVRQATRAAGLQKALTKMKRAD